MGTSIFRGLIPPDDPRMQRTSIIVGQTLRIGSGKPEPESQEAQEAEPVEEVQARRKTQRSAKRKPIKAKDVLCVSGLLLSGLVAASSAFANPTTSPSARAAVRLKYNPPKTWIRHYLGDDRYKIAGGVWKVVSTDLDSSYHRPNCPNMLRQPAEIVIGFASPRDAVEGGLGPCSVCLPQARVVAYARNEAKRNSTRATSRRNTGQRGNTAAKAQPTTLTIKVSQIPKNIRSFIALVDGLADQIEGASSGNIGAIKSTVDKLIDDMRRGVSSPYAGNGSANDDRVIMLTILQTLRSAANGKSTSLSSSGPLRGSPGTYRSLLDSARHEARELIPQVKAWRKTQPKRDLLGEIANAPVKSTSQSRVRMGS